MRLVLTFEKDGEREGKRMNSNGSFCSKMPCFSDSAGLLFFIVIQISSSNWLKLF